MSKSDSENEKLSKRAATWLPRLADPADVAAAGMALYEIQMAAIEQRPDEAASQVGPDESPSARRAAESEWFYRPAVQRLAAELDDLIPRWVDAFLTLLRAAADAKRKWDEAVRACDKLPDFNWQPVIAINALESVLHACRERLDPHLSPLVTALGTLDRDRDENLAGAICTAGPAIVAAIGTLLDILRTRGVWCWPSKLAAALTRAARFDASVVPAVRAILTSADGDDQVRQGAITVLEEFGALARPAADELLDLARNSPRFRTGATHALARQGDAAPALLDLLESNLRDADGYVRRAAAYALGKLRAEPARFVPLLIEACDDAEPLHDTSMPEAAIETLAMYGPAAQQALPRLEQFLSGPIEGRTVDPEDVEWAIARIAADSDIRVGTTDAKPAIRRRSAASLDATEPLFDVLHNGRQCYIDREGNVVIELDFATSGQPFCGGRAIVFDDDYRAYAIDREGRVVFHSEWDDIKDFSEGFAAVERDGRWGFVDRDGRVVVEPQYDSVTRFSEGLAGVERGREEVPLGKAMTFDRRGRRGFIDDSGTVVIPIEHLHAEAFSGSRALTCTGGVMKPNPILDGLATLGERKYGFIDRTGRLVVPGVYDLASSFREGLAAVTQGEFRGRARSGFIDRDGVVALPLVFRHAQQFRDGLSRVTPRGRRHRTTTTVIDRRGNVVLETPLQLGWEGFSEGLAAAYIGDAWGVIDLEGKTVIPPQFDDIGPFTAGVARVQRGKWSGLIDRAGRFIWGPTTESCAFDRVLESDWT